MFDQAPKETFGFWVGNARLAFSTGYHNVSSLALGLHGIWKESAVRILEIIPAPEDQGISVKADAVSGKAREISEMMAGQLLVGSQEEV